MDQLPVQEQAELEDGCCTLATLHLALAALSGGSSIMSKTYGLYEMVAFQLRNTIEVNAIPWDHMADFLSQLPPFSSASPAHRSQLLLTLKRKYSVVSRSAFQEMVAPCVQMGVLSLDIV
eukprot:m.126547 g.126547  ORF g.126547 m.126547 type:complete len:120 (-) comp13835_c1_seq2:141-500(-)